MTTVRRGVMLLALAGPLGCKPAPTFDRAASEAWRQDVNVQMRSDVSPLSAIDSHYFGGEAPLRIGLVDGTPAADPPPDVDAVQLRAAEIDEARRIELGRFILFVAPQPPGEQGPTGRVIVHDPQAASLSAFTGLRFFPIDEAQFAAARFEPTAEGETSVLATTRGLQKPLPVAGTLRFRLGDADHELLAHDAGPAEDGGRTLFIMFTDDTTGDSTYPVGRYLEAQLSPGASKVGLDFNRAHNPWCAYSPHYNCPVPPAGNKIAAAIAAGERTFWADH